MSRHEIEHFFSNDGTRNEVRKRVISAFLEEEPGLGAGEDASRYKYYVEWLNSGDRIYLTRPAPLNNGFDFKIAVENTNYASPEERRRSMPKHDDIYNDLLEKKNENIFMYRKLYVLLQKVYECHDVTDEEMDEIQFNSGLPVDHILKVIKWLFIEQDIRYWNKSGRVMTWGIVPSP